MSDLDTCDHCGADPNVAFVRYAVDANDAQKRTGWYDGMADRLYSIVCTDCGMGIATLDPRENPDLPDFEDLPDGTGNASDFRVDETLE